MVAVTRQSRFYRQVSQSPTGSNLVNSLCYAARKSAKTVKPQQNSRKRTMTPPIIRSLISLSLTKSSHFQKPFSCYSISVVFLSSSTAARESNRSLDFADHFIKKHKFSPELALKAASSLSYLTLRKPDKCDNIISFLKEVGLSKSHIEEAVRRKPSLLSGSLEKILKPKVKVFQDLGFSADDIAAIVSADPWMLTRSANDRLAPSISGLKSVVGSNAGVAKVLKTSTWLLTSDLEKTMLPNIEFMRSCGISLSQIVKYVFSFPRFFLHKPESIKNFVKRVDEMGFDRKSNMFLLAIRTLSSMSEENWELKLKLFRRLGFSEDDIRNTFLRTPQVFAVSERKIMEVTEVLLSRKNIGLSFIINHPTVFIFSVKHRLKPRLAVFEILESKDLLGRKLSLSTLFKISEKQFQERYVQPYLKELETSSMAIVGS